MQISTCARHDSLGDGRKITDLLQTITSCHDLSSEFDAALRADRAMSVSQAIDNILLSPLEKNMARHMSHIKSTLERQGYGVIVRCKNGNQVQIETSKDGLPLLASTRVFHPDHVYLSTSVGLCNRLRTNKNGVQDSVQTSFKAFNDYEWAEFEALRLNFLCFS